MDDLVSRRVRVAWSVLVSATLLSWWLGVEHALLGAQSAGVAVLLVAFIKVRLIGMTFMELRTAPTPLRAAYDGWCTVVAALVIALYLAA